MTDLESTVATLEGSLKMVNENYVGLRYLQISTVEISILKIVNENYVGLR